MGEKTQTDFNLYTVVGIICSLIFVGVVLLFLVSRSCLRRKWEHRRRFPVENVRDRGMSHSVALSPQLPGFSWLWKRRFEKKEDQVKQLLSTHLKPLHVMSTVKYQDKETSEIYDSWNDVAQYMNDNPICTSVLPTEFPIVQRRLFMFDTIRYLRLKKKKVVEGMEDWLSELESILLLGVLRVDSWRVYLDHFRRLALSNPWLKVWNYRPREHLDFLFMPLATPEGGKIGMMGRFVISFSDITLVETTKSPPQSRWKRWWAYWEDHDELDWVNLAVDHRKYCETAPPCPPSEQLLIDSSDMAFTRALVHKKMIILDICSPDDRDMSFDILSSDLNIHLGLLPLLFKPKEAPIPLELILILFRKSVLSWKQFKDAFSEHVNALKSYIYDNRAQKAMIDTIMSSLKLTHNLGSIAEHNVIVIGKFLEQNTRVIDGNIAAFWSWEMPPPTLQETWPEVAHELSKISEFFRDSHVQSKEYDKELREMMQMVFNLVSIDEAYRSREQAVSLKRMSWITFIFLPLLFAASLFGMNIDILDNNPSWTWYLVVCAPALCVVWGVWFAYRISDHRRSVLEETPFKSA